MKFSIIIPSFNSASYISQTINSVLRQSYKSFEIIIVDGGSNDGTKELIDGMGSIIDVFIFEPDKGQLHAVQKGIAVSTGDIVYWLNADDILMPNSLNYVAKKFEENDNVDIVFSDNFAFCSEDKKLSVGATIKGLNYKDHALYYRQMYSECIFWRARKTKFVDEEFYSLRIYTDYAFFLNLRKDCKTLWVPKRLGAFRVREGQMSLIHKEKKETEFELIRSHAYKANGWSKTEVISKRNAHYFSFICRQVLYVKFNSILRRVVRTLTFDKRRKAQSQVFFEKWLNESAIINFDLSEILHR